MRNLIIILALIFILPSCKTPGTNSTKRASTVYNKTKELNSKKPISFDEKFGIQVYLKDFDSTTNTLNYTKVWISKKHYDELPTPSDSVNVLIDYIENIEYGSTGYDYEGLFMGIISLWDFKFNLCTGYSVVRNK